MITGKKITEEERFFSGDSPFENDDAFEIRYRAPISDKETFHALIDFAIYCGIIDVVGQSHMYRGVEGNNYLRFRIFETDIPELINLLPDDGIAEVTIRKLTRDDGNALYYDKYIG